MARLSPKGWRAWLQWRMHIPLSHSRHRTLSLFVLAVTLALCSTQALAQTPASNAVTSVKPTGGLWGSGDGFAFDLGKKKAIKTRQSVSGVACTLDAQKNRLCLVVFDEGTQARYATVQSGKLVVDAEQVVFVGIAGELDAEAAATDGRYVYVTGSHSAKRSDCNSNPHSRHVIRMAIDPKTGRAMKTGYADTGRLWQVMQSQPALAPFVGEGKCLGSEPQGINIEGMAIQAGRLHFGFRGPVVNGAAFVMALDADALFGGADPKATVHRLALGAHRGIRDMVAVSNGFLILAGPDDDSVGRNAGWAFFWWDGQVGGATIEPKPLGVLDLSAVKLRKCDETLKPESLTVLEETPQSWKLLVLSDGMCDGGALEFSVMR